MARKAMVEKSKRKPKFAGAGAQSLRPLRPVARVPAPVRPLPHLFPRAVAVRDDSRRAKGLMVERVGRGTWNVGRSRQLPACRFVQRPRSNLQPSTFHAPRSITLHVPGYERTRTSLMSMTDPIADMLTRIRNACGSKHRRVDMPLSKMKTEIARILKENNYIQDYSTLETDEGQPAAPRAAQVRRRPVRDPRNCSACPRRGSASTSAPTRSRACATASASRSSAPTRA